jgi:hypothetical protein
MITFIQQWCFSRLRSDSSSSDFGYLSPTVSNFNLKTLLNFRFQELYSCNCFFLATTFLNKLPFHGSLARPSKQPCSFWPRLNSTCFLVGCVVNGPHLSVARPLKKPCPFGPRLNSTCFFGGMCGKWPHLSMARSCSQPSS